MLIYIYSNICIDAFKITKNLVKKYILLLGILWPKKYLHTQRDLYRVNRYIYVT